MTKVNGDEELWTIYALPVDGLSPPLRGFRKSHHFVPASPDPDASEHRGLQFAAARMTGASAYRVRIARIRIL
jgi:hypothetical protein